ncbi:MAG: hypothetical protein DWQ02_21000 [Bacteroidetes bacterium]|nr:MAG: hypothetical protein DWQ02_21000 [Bacteroidota bacterium]
MIWPELVRLALLGGERGTLTPELRQKLESYGIQTDSPFPEVLLESAALFNQIRKAAFQLEDFEGSLPEPITESDEQTCSPRSTAHLFAILDGRFAPALEEFLYHLKENGKKIPNETLPVLLNASLEDDELWELLRPVLGKQGEWLLEQWPPWGKLKGVQTIKDWNLTPLQDRRAYLKYLRADNPEKALELLKVHWDSLKAGDKFPLLKTLELNLSGKDELFLEQLLDERSKKLRLEAAKLLSGLGNSALIERLFLALLDFVHISDNAINFDLPENLPESTLRDGIHPVPLKESGGGMKAAWLRQITSRIPPRRWSELIDKDPAECLSFFLNNRWSDQLLPAIAEAALLHNDEEWMAAILEHGMTNGFNHDIPSNLLKGMMKKLPREAIISLAEYGSEVLPRLVENKSIFFLLLTNNKEAWTDKVSIWLLQNFKDWMRNQKQGFGNLEHYRDLIQAGTYSINPALTEKFKIGWPTNNTTWYYWEDAIDKMIRTLNFRRDMVKSLRG